MLLTNILNIKGVKGHVHSTRAKPLMKKELLKNLFKGVNHLNPRRRARITVSLDYLLEY